MKTFVIYDLIFMGLFALFITLFLLKNKKNLTRQGIMFLYKTKFGVIFIDRFAKKYEKILKPTRYLVLFSGYMLMIAMLWMIVRLTIVYLTTPIASLIRAPPIAPLIPYFPKVFGLESFFPPLYFTYFILALAIVILSHEGAHGIFARLENFKIHSTGFAFLGPIPGAFVEPDEKQMQKAKIFPQLSVLAAGTFANVIMTIIFGVAMIILFAAFFIPSGVIFNSYATSPVLLGEANIKELSAYDGFVEIEYAGENFYADKMAIDYALKNDFEVFLAYSESLAFKSQIPPGSAIVEINGNTITGREELSEVLSQHNKGDEIVLKVAILEPGQGVVKEIKEINVELEELNGRAFLGVGFYPPSTGVITSFIYKNTLSKVKEPNVHYISRIGDFGWFLYYLLWWIVLINIAVALFNMLPLGILDGGRFFYLSVVALTRKERAGQIAYKIATIFLLVLLGVMMFKWAAAFF